MHDISIISADDFSINDLLTEEIPEKYLLDDKGNFCFACTTSGSPLLANDIIKFLFQLTETPSLIFSNENAIIYDLTPVRQKLISYEKMEESYPLWLEETGRENTMNEFGMLIDFRGFSEHGKDRKYTLMIITKRNYKIL